MRPHSIIRTLAATALIALPSLAMAAPDQNTNNNGCPNGQWRNGNGQCVSNGNNGQWNNGNNGNGQWNNGRHHDRDDRDDRNRRDNDDRNNRNNNGAYNNGAYNNGGYNNGGYNNGSYGRGNQLSGSVRSFSPYNLYLSNGTHVVLHNGTVISPTGSNLTAGQRVRVVGSWNQDGTFNANEIDVTGNGNGYNRYQR